VIPLAHAAFRFRTLAGPVEAETTVRRSRFLARAVPVEDQADAAAFHAAEARAHVNPTHVVPAFRLRDGTAWASDAGEPAGSSGAPLLAVLEGAGLADVACVVVRWFGGVKLGVGGLVRAYGAALAAALDGAPVAEAVSGSRLRVVYGHEHTAAVMRALQLAGARDVAHGLAGERPEILLSLADGSEDAFAAGLRDATRGAVVPERLHGVVLRWPGR
jgi:putative IMPACT (imprinted ancient) family translation regulator